MSDVSRTTKDKFSDFSQCAMTVTENPFTQVTIFVLSILVISVAAVGIRIIDQNNPKYGPASKSGDMAWFVIVLIIAIICCLTSIILFGRWATSSFSVNINAKY